MFKEKAFFFYNLFKDDSDKGLFWNDIEELKFKEEIYKLREEYNIYLNDTSIRDKDYIVYDESEEEDSELRDDFISNIDVFIVCEHLELIHTERENYLFIFIFLFLLFNGFFFFSIIYLLFAGVYFLSVVDDDTERETMNMGYNLTKFLNRAFSILNKRLKKRVEFKDKSILLLNRNDLFYFILDKNFSYNNINLFAENVEYFIFKWYKRHSKFFKLCYYHLISFNSLEVIVYAWSINRYYTYSIIPFFFKFRKKKFKKNFIKDKLIYKKKKYVIYDNIYYTDYIYHIIIYDINYLYYHKKFSSKCYLII